MAVIYPQMPNLESLSNEDARLLRKWASELTRELVVDSEKLYNTASDPYGIAKYRNTGAGGISRNAGTVVAVSATVGASVNHALRGRPAQVWVQPDSSIGPWWISSRTTVAFTVRWNGATSVNLFWSAEL